MEKTISSLSNLREGETGTIISMDCRSELTRRLMDMGFISGTRVRRLQSSPAGNPIAYMVRGTVIALRNSDSSEILVEL